MGGSMYRDVDNLTMLIGDVCCEVCQQMNSNQIEPDAFVVSLVVSMVFGMQMAQEMILDSVV